MNAPCPTCGADAYRLCVDRSGTPMALDYHPARRGETPLLALAKLAASVEGIIRFRDGGKCIVCGEPDGYHEMTCAFALALRIIDENGLSPMELIAAHENRSPAPSPHGVASKSLGSVEGRGSIYTEGGEG